jgi:hypothetical protein
MGFDTKWLRGTCAVLVGMGVSLGVQQAHANGMRCNSKLVDRGDTTYEVKSLCGPPDDARQRIERRSVRRLVEVPCGTGRCPIVVEEMVEVAVDEWLYDFGPQRFIQHLTFEQGKLVDVQSGKYGTKQI